MDNNIKRLFNPPSASRLHPVRPFFIAEAGVNHGGNMDTAKRLIDEAKKGGADAVKFQTYKAATLACKESPSYWDTNKEPTRSQFELFSRFDKFWKNEYEELKAYCDKLDIVFLSTPFDLESVDFLDDLMPFFKVASADLTNRPFLDHVTSKGKPVVLSTGASNLDEIRASVEWVESSGCPLALLHCILNYPTADEDANLGMIYDLKEKFPSVPIGYSDHTLPADMKVLELAVMLGVTIIEKHFTHDKSLPGNDHYHAADYRDLETFNSLMDRIFPIMGSFDKTSLSSEGAACNHARRSLVSSREIQQGEVITASHLTFKRPASGISPALQDQVIGRIAKHNIPEDKPIQWEFLQDQ